MVAEHPVILYYSPAPGQGYAVASASYTGHFTWQQNFPKLIKDLRKTKGFFQSMQSQQEQIPL